MDRVVCLVGSLSISHLLETRVPLAETFLVGITVLTIVFTFLPPRLLATSLEREGCQEAYTFVHSSSSERILSEDVSALVLSGKPVLVSNPFLVTQLANSVAWSRGSLTFLVDKQYFDLIALEGKSGTVSAPGRWEPLLMKEVSEHYKLERDFQCSTLTSVFVPK